MFGLTLVAVDGYRTCYKYGIHAGVFKEDMKTISIWVVPRIINIRPKRFERLGFFIYRRDFEYV